MIKSGIEVKNTKVLSQTLSWSLVFFFFFDECASCDLLLQIRKMILPSFYDIMAIVNCSQVSWCRWPCEDKH